MLVAFKFAQSMEKVGVLRLDVGLGGEAWARRSWALLLAPLAVWYHADHADCKCTWDVVDQSQLLNCRLTVDAPAF